MSIGQMVEEKNAMPIIKDPAGGFMDEMANVYRKRLPAGEGGLCYELVMAPLFDG
jgi:hypothetical protein